MSHNLQNTTEHKAYNHTQSFSPAGTQCLPPPYTIHRASASRNTELPHPSHRASPPISGRNTTTPQAKLCAFSSPFHRTITLQKYHLPEHKAYNHTQSFSPAGTQCLTSTIHNTQSFTLARTQSFNFQRFHTQSFTAHLRPQRPTPQAKLCAFSSPFHRVITFRNTKLVIEHRASPPREHSA